MAIYKNNELEEYPLYGLDMIGKLVKDAPQYYYKDHLGSVRAVVNSDNEVLSAQDYDAWGYLLEGRQYESDSSKFKFTGKERDEESQYDYFGARYYDARIGRWGSTDPLLEKHFDFTPYNYVLNNPLYYIDPDGKQEASIGLTIWEAVKYSFVKTVQTVAPLAGVSLNPVGVILGSLVNPSQLGNVVKYTEFLDEQRLSVEELYPKYSTEEIVVTSLESRSYQKEKLTKYIGKSDKAIKDAFDKMKNTPKKDRDKKEYKDLQTEMKARNMKQSGYRDKSKKNDN